jgi:hypothetical protein
MHRPESREGLLPLPSRVCALPPFPPSPRPLPPRPPPPPAAAAAAAAAAALSPLSLLSSCAGWTGGLVYMTCVCFNPHFLWPSRVTTPGMHTPSCYVSLFISLLRDFDEGSGNLRCYSFAVAAVTVMGRECQDNRAGNSRTRNVLVYRACQPHKSRKDRAKIRSRGLDVNSGCT